MKSITVQRILLTTVTIKQIYHTVHVSVFNDESFIHPSPMMTSEHKIMGHHRSQTIHGESCMYMTMTGLSQAA